MKIYILYLYYIYMKIYNLYKLAIELLTHYAYE